MVVSSTDEEGNTTEYTYDKYYRTLTETKDGSTITYTYETLYNRFIKNLVKSNSRDWLISFGLGRYIRR